MENRDSLFLIVTAIDQDPSLSSLTRALHGMPVAKGLAMITSSGSLLQQTVASFQSVVSSHRIYAVVSARDEGRARGQLDSWSGARVVGVPDDLGSASSVMQVLAEVLSESPEADVMVASADGYLANPRPFVSAMLAARERLGMVPAVLMGASLPRAFGYGRWLLPGKRLAENMYTFHEAKLPATEEEARRMVALGAMWNTRSFVARARFLWQLLARELPTQAESIVQLWRMGCPVTEKLAHAVAEAAVGETVADHLEVLLHECTSIAVAKIDGCGWSDWDSPEEVLHSIPNPLERGWLLSRLAPAPDVAPITRVERVARPLQDSGTTAVSRDVPVGDDMPVGATMAAKA